MESAVSANSFRLNSGDSLIISGVSFGVGRALAPTLARQGINLALNARSTEPLAEAAQECSSLGVKAATVAGDVSRDEVALELVQAAQGLGGFAGFIHVAGILNPGPTVWELPGPDAAAVMDASFGGALALIRAALPTLLAQKRGLAVVFGSGAAERQQPGIGVYCVAKAAEEALLRELAAETRDIAALHLPARCGADPHAEPGHGIHWRSGPYHKTHIQKLEGRGAFAHPGGFRRPPGQGAHGRAGALARPSRGCPGGGGG
jgi:NADP-dependent 3-hydroxy acid dehydrogenase YdfG